MSERERLRFRIKKDGRFFGYWVERETRPGVWWSIGYYLTYWKARRVAEYRDRVVWVSDEGPRR